MEIKGCSAGFSLDRRRANEQENRAMLKECTYKKGQVGPQKWGGSEERDVTTSHSSEKKDTRWSEGPGISWYKMQSASM